MKKISTLFVHFFVFLFAAGTLFSAKLSSPESVLYDDTRGQYIVSNVGVTGMPDGHIVLIDTLGNMENLLTDSLTPIDEGRILVIAKDKNGDVDWIDAAELAQSAGITILIIHVLLKINNNSSQITL